MCRVMTHTVEQPSNVDITTFVLSCNRLDLLRETMESFLRFQDLPTRMVIVDDSGQAGVFEKLVAAYGSFADVVCFPENRGYLWGMDFMVSYCQTPWIFYLEDDWRFTRTGFLTASKKILETHREIGSVDLSWRTWEQDGLVTYDTRQDPEGFYWKKAWRISPTHLCWYGWMGSPNLKRRDDWLLMGRIEKWHQEWNIDRKFRALGLLGVFLAPPAYVEHIGDDNSALAPRRSKNENTTPEDFFPPELRKYRTMPVLDWRALDTEYIEEPKVKTMRVIDIGCGPGLYVEELRKAGLDAVGVDVDPQLQESAYLHKVDVLSPQFQERFKDFDLALCLEVAEHIPECEADRFVAALTGCAKTIIFSAAVPGQGGIGHINCQDKTYWIEKFAKHGFAPDTGTTDDFLGFMSAGQHMGWLTNNAVVFRSYGAQNFDVIEQEEAPQAKRIAEYLARTVGAPPVAPRENRPSKSLVMRKKGHTMLHLLGLPHTVTNEAYSHCAYTGKILKFPKMMAELDKYDIVHYGVAGATVNCEHVDVLSQDEQQTLIGETRSKTDFVGDLANTDNALYKEFNKRLRRLLHPRVGPKDLVLLPFGHAHWQAIEGRKYNLIESGIGYPELYQPAQWRVYESYAWMHWHQGKANRNGSSYEWVVPNYFDTTEWELNPVGEPNTIVYFGRICQIKGLDTVVALAKELPNYTFILCGQGDPKPYLVSPNIVYKEPISGRERSDLLGNAAAVIMPTVYTEPFGGVAVEAQMCGTPVLASPFGAFTETIEDGVTGFLCHTLGDYMAAVKQLPGVNRIYVSDRARRLYGFQRVAKMYDRVFQQIIDLRSNGWYEKRSSLGDVL